MREKKLSFDEIELVRDKILREYDHYIVQYMKSRELRNHFEDRYIGALKARMDMTRFLHAELSTVRDLREREEGRVRNENNAAITRAEAARRGPKPGFADRIIQANREKIEKYPDKEIDPDASIEVRRLFGAMNDFERRFWPDIERCMRRISPTLYSGPRIVLERKIFDLWSDTKEGVSPRLAGYAALFRRFPRNTRDITREEQRFIVDSGYLMHEIAEEIGRVKDNEVLEEVDRRYLETMYEYMHTVITDFRLNDFRAK